MAGKKLRSSFKKQRKDFVTDRSLTLPTKPLIVSTGWQPPTLQAESGPSRPSLFSFDWLKRLLTLFTPSDWKTENELSGEIWLDEFSQIIKKKKLTVETYHSMLFSLKIVCYLVNNNVEDCLDREQLTMRRCFEEISRGLNSFYSQTSLEGKSIAHLKRDVSWLKSSYLDPHHDDVESESEVTISYASKDFLNKSLPRVDRFLAGKVVIISKILQNLTKPEDAVLYCLQWLEKLHGVYSLLVQEGKTIFRKRNKSCDFTECILNINKLLFQFVRMFLKPPPTVEEWPATIQIYEKIYNPLIDKQLLKERLIGGGKAVSTGVKLDIGRVNIRVENPITDVEVYDAQIIETPGGSITVNQKGGHFSLPVASAFLLIPPNAVSEKVTLTFSRVRYNDPEAVKPRDGEVFVSRILKIEPEGVVFRKPVTVLFSHSLYEDQVFLDFYELIVKNLSMTGWQDLKTERISFMEDVPKEISNPEILADCLPIAKATIHETCTLVAVTQVRSHQILIPTNRSYTFSKQYGKNAQLKITFPAGVTNNILILTVQVFPPDAVLKKDVRLDKSLVCAPVIRVSGQKTDFLQAVDVELTYSHSDVVNIEEEFLPVGKPVKFTTKYGLLLRSHKGDESSSEWFNLNEDIDVCIERPSEDRLKFSFQLRYFSHVQLVVKTSSRDSYVPPAKSGMVDMKNPACHSAIVLAVHETSGCPMKLRAILAPKSALQEVKARWKVRNKVRKFEKSLKFEETVYFCVPLSESNDDVHLSLKDHALRFDPDAKIGSVLENSTSDDVDLKGKSMRFLKDRECKNGINHSTQEDCRAKAPIHISSNIRWDLTCWIILVVGIFFGFLPVKFGESFYSLVLVNVFIAFTLLAVIVGIIVLILQSVILRRRHSSKRLMESRKKDFIQRYAVSSMGLRNIPPESVALERLLRPPVASPIYRRRFLTRKFPAPAGKEQCLDMSHIRQCIRLDSMKSLNYPGSYSEFKNREDKNNSSTTERLPELPPERPPKPARLKSRPTQLQEKDFESDNENSDCGYLEFINEQDKNESSTTSPMLDVYEVDAELNDPVYVVKEYSAPIVEILSNSITIDQKGGYFSLPVASAFLLIPPEAVSEEVTLTCSRVRYNDPEAVKPRDGEVFVSRILKIEPEGVIFRKPVTVLLSHSLYEDGDYRYFYDLVVENFSSIGCEELTTQRISSSEDVPKEISNPEVLDDYLPIARATVCQPCILVAAARVRSHQISIPTNKSYTFSEQYGESAQLKIAFPAGVVKEILCLKVQLFPAGVFPNKVVPLDKENLLRAPLIRVSGETTSFLKSVDVELTYSHSDVINIEEDFLPVGKRIHFTTEYGLLLHSRKETELTSKCETLNETNKAYIERPRRDQIKFFFSVEHFSDVEPTVKMKRPNSGKQSISSSSMDRNSLTCQTNSLPHIPSLEEPALTDIPPFHRAIVFAVHETGSSPKKLYAVLAPRQSFKDVRTRWSVIPKFIRKFDDPLRSKEQVYICVPSSEENDDDHLPLKDYTLRFDPDPEIESVLDNNTDDDVNLSGKHMRYLKNRECNKGRNHSTQGDCRAKAPINISKSLVQDHVAPVCELPSPLTVQSRKENGVSFIHDVTRNPHVSCQNEVMRKNLGCCEYFEREIENKCLEKLGINKNEIQNPNIGATAKVLNDAGAVTSIMLGLSVGATIALSIGSFGIGSLVGATVAGVTFTVTKIDKKMKKSTAKKLDKKVEIYFHSHLKCIIMDTAKELSRIFEYQVLTLKDGSQIDILAECAVNLMLHLKEGDTFDRNTLLKKVLQDGRIDKRELVTTNGDKWSAPDVFRKPGLQRTVVGTHRAEFTYQVKPNGCCEPRKYGYRGQFLETRKYGSQNKENEGVKVTRFRKKPATNETHTCEDSYGESCKECPSNHENCTYGEYFVESDIDSQYTEPQNELLTYHPIHILVQCPKILNSFISAQLQEEKTSFADFLKKKFGLPEDHLVRPVYRQHSPGKIPDLQKSDLTGSDFSHSDFTDSCLEKCSFTKCVMLFAELARAKMSGSKFCETFISHSNLIEVKADQCEWTKTSLLFSLVDRARLDSVVSSIGGNRLDGTNICDAITVLKKEVNCNETEV